MKTNESCQDIITSFSEAVKDKSDALHLIYSDEEGIDDAWTEVCAHPGRTLMLMKTSRPLLRLSLDDMSHCSPSRSY